MGSQGLSGRAIAKVAGRLGGNGEADTTIGVVDAFAAMCRSSAGSIPCGKPLRGVGTGLLEHHCVLMEKPGRLARADVIVDIRNLASWGLRCSVVLCPFVRLWGDPCSQSR